MKMMNFDVLNECILFYLRKKGYFYVDRVQVMLNLYLYRPQKYHILTQSQRTNHYGTYCQSYQSKQQRNAQNPFKRIDSRRFPLLLISVIIPCLNEQANQVNITLSCLSQQQFSTFLFSRHSCAQSSTNINSKLGKNFKPISSHILLQNLKLPSIKTSLYLVSMSRMYFRQSSMVLLVTDPKILRPRVFGLSVRAVSIIQVRMRFIFSCRAYNRVPNSASSACFAALSRGRAMRSTKRILYRSSIMRRVSSSGLFSVTSYEFRLRPTLVLPRCFDINELLQVSPVASPTTQHSLNIKQAYQACQIA